VPKGQYWEFVVEQTWFSKIASPVLTPIAVGRVGYISPAVSHMKPGGQIMQ